MSLCLLALMRMCNVIGQLVHSTNNVSAQVCANWGGGANKPIDPVRSLAMALHHVA